jgi:hypothetical protein
MLIYRIEHDQDPCNPRTEWDNLGTIVYAHRGCRLGDIDATKEYPDANGWDDIERAIERENGPCVMLSVYCYEHGGITVSTGTFGCPWDSGRIGVIYVPRSKVLKEWGKKRLTKALRSKVREDLKGEIETFAQYLEGEIYGYVIEDPEGNHIDSCWGFYGREYCETEAKAALAYAMRSWNPVDAEETEETLA